MPRPPAPRRWQPLQLRPRTYSFTSVFANTARPDPTLCSEAADLLDGSVTPSQRHSMPANEVIHVLQDEQDGYSDGLAAPTVLPTHLKESVRWSQKMGG